jgi:parallel beta-helix repeat protein
MARDNGFSTGIGSGIHSTSSDNRIEDNNVVDNDLGIEVASSGSLIIKNSASGNTLNYVIAASNQYGVILDLTAPGSAAASGSSAPSTLTTTTNPWANFSY